uniref:Uncharacterized protein n=1 Tax=Timema poppense TaxID=170557 RepID=A0A7R9DT21_TIMPO|nr:unnamed protein product [Timema poppensis]
MIELRSKADEYFITFYVSYKNSTKIDPYLLQLPGCDALCPLESFVSYKNSTETDPHLLQLPGCDALCPLHSFVELTKPIIPDDLTTECAEEVVSGQEYHFEIPAAEPFLKNTLSTPDRDLNLSLLVIGTIVYCESSALVHLATDQFYLSGDIVFSNQLPDIM